MPVFLEIRAIACGLALHIDLFRQAAIHEGLEAIVNSRKGDRGNAFFRSNENFGCGWVVTFVEENIVHFPTLRSETMTAVCDRLLVA
jgi:hypothetical protein